MRRKRHIKDPVEKIVEKALEESGTYFKHETEMPHNRNKLDFYIPTDQSWIECKQFHTDRTLSQLEKFDNVILIQGKSAAKTFAKIVENSKNRDKGIER